MARGPPPGGPARLAVPTKSPAGGSPASGPSPAPDYAADSSNAAVNTLLPSAHGTRSTFTPHREHDTRHGVCCSHTGIRPHGRCRHTRAGRRLYRSGPPSECRRRPTRPAVASALWTPTLAVRSDGTIVRGLAATGTEARRWLEAVQTHGRRTALAQVALAATTPATPGEGHKGTTVSARNWRVVTDWTTPGAETYDPRGLEETPPGSRTVIIDQQGGLHELTAPAAPAPDSNPRTFLEYLAALGTVEKHPLAVVHAAPAAPPWIGVQRNRTGVTELTGDDD